MPTASLPWGQLTASIAHEIKQPIATARNNARAALNFLDKSPPNVGAEVREALNCIVNDADRASDVVDRIGSLIKKTPSRKEVVDLNAAILEVTALTHSEAVKAGVTVGTQLAGELPRIQCDRVQLQQVMLNLIVNAIQSMSGVADDNRELHISTVSIEPEGVRVAVRDTGYGLRPESLPRLFEPFYTTKPDGMGMGLSICRSIIEAHRGRLWATSMTKRVNAPAREHATSRPASACSIGSRRSSSFALRCPITGRSTGRRSTATPIR
jgi:signal transduction histidine kinase